MANIYPKTFSITKNGNTYILRGVTSEELTKIQNALTQHQDISGKMNLSLKGAANGVAELDEYGKVPSSQLPSYVDDVLEYATLQNFPEYGETGKVYIAINTNITYRWSGSTYVPIGSDLALGETSSTAYRGDRGAEAYAHAVTNKGSAFASGFYKITTNSEGHITEAVAVTKNDLINLGVSDLVLGDDDDTAFRGDYGAAAYAHSVTNKGSAFASGLYKITTNAEGHVTDAVQIVLSDLTDMGVAAAANFNTINRRYWTSTNSIDVPLDDEKTYLALCGGATSGTSGALMDATYGAIILVSNGKFGVIFKGTGISVSETSDELTISSVENIAMAVIEL